LRRGRASAPPAANGAGGRHCLRSNKRRQSERKEDIAGAALIDSVDAYFVAGQLTAEVRRFEQRSCSPADVPVEAGPVFRPQQLPLDQVDEIVDEEQVADLLARSSGRNGSTG
jgi:hypothetical protein